MSPASVFVLFIHHVASVYQFDVHVSFNCGWEIMEATLNSDWELTVNYLDELKMVSDEHKKNKTEDPRQDRIDV
jgi:hypothetical protein